MTQKGLLQGGEKIKGPSGVHRNRDRHGRTMAGVWIAGKKSTKEPGNVNVRSASLNQTGAPTEP